MGLFTAAFMKTHGVETLVVSEPVKVRREMAKQFGADILHDPNDVPLEEVVADVTDQGRGFSVTAEAVGKPELVAACIDVTKPRGHGAHDRRQSTGCTVAGGPLRHALPRDQTRWRLRTRQRISTASPANSRNSILKTSSLVAFLLPNCPDAITASAEGLGVKFAIKPERLTTNNLGRSNMKAMTWQGGNRFTHDDVPDPVVEPGYVVVKMDTTGICGTDVHATQGLFPWYPPQIMGHEGSGVIVEVGEGVAKDRIGQRVAVNRKAQCYECWSCRNWNTFRCEVARESENGMYAEYVRRSTPVPPSNFRRISTSKPPS